MNFGYSSNGNGGYQNCPPQGRAGNRGQALVPYGSRSTARMTSGGAYPTMSSPNNYSGQYGGGYPQQQMSGARGRQQVGRRATSVQNQNVGAMVPLQMRPQPQGGVPRSFMTPQLNGPMPINVKITADMLASANNSPVYSDRGEPTVEGNSNVKYIPLSWDSILGQTGMNGMRVSMAPPAGGDPNQNRQLKVSFGGPGVSQAGETPLKVVSFNPVMNSGRMDAQPQGTRMNFPQGGQGQGQYMMGQGQQPSRSCNCPNCRR